MADQTQNVVINFETDTTGLEDGLTKLEKLGEIDDATAVIFKKTNDQIKTRNLLLQQSLDTHETLTASVTDEQAIFNKLVASVKNLSGASKEAVQTLLQMTPSQVAKGFREAAVNVDDYVQALESAGSATDSLAKKNLTLRTQILQNKNALAEMVQAGLQNTEEFTQLSLATGKLQNDLTQTNLTIRRLASDSPLLSAFGEGVTGLAGAFQAAAGASALFGDKNKDLQETLVKVTSVTAIAQGLQQAFNLVRKESAITTAALVIQQKLLNAQTQIDIALQKESIVARTGARIAQVALNLATAAGPVGIIAAALAVATAAWVSYTSAAEEAAQKQKEFDEELAKTGALLDANVAAAQRAGDSQVAALEQTNAKQSEVLRAQAQTQLDVIRKIKKARDDAADLAQQNISQLDDAEKKNYEDALKRSEDLTDKLKAAQADLDKINAKGAKQTKEESLQASKDLADAELSQAAKNTTRQFALQKEVIAKQLEFELNAAGDNEQKKAALVTAARRAQKDVDIAEAQFVEDNKLAILDRALIKAQTKRKQSSDVAGKAEIDAQNAIVLEQANFAVRNEKLTQQEKLDIIDKANAQIAENNRNFAKQQAIQAQDDLIALNQVTLSEVNATEQEKLNARIRTISETAEKEIIANRGKVDIIKGIEAKRDQDIREARLASVQAELEAELKLEEAKNGATVREIQRQLDAQDTITSAQGLGGDKRAAQQQNVSQLSLDQQKGLIDKLTNFQLEALDKRQAALDQNFANGLISQKDYDLQTQQLIDEQAKVFDDGEKKKRDSVNKTADLEKKRRQEVTQITLQAISDGLNTIGQFNQQADEAAQARIDSQRKNIQDLQEAGDISAKEAAVRNKKLDEEQKRNQIQQAKRDKALALFTATINTALAVTNAIATGDPYTAALRAAIVIALGAAQIALIASKPLPTFKGGKKKGQSFEGLGVWGEAGAELMERNGKMYVATKPTVSYIQPGDVIYNPKETAQMIGNRVGSSSIPQGLGAGRSAPGIDYSKLGKTIAENTQQQSGLLFENGAFHEFIKQGNQLTKYLNKRRRWD